MLTLKTPLSQLIGIGPATLKRLKNVSLEKVEDLIFYFPRRYDDFSATIPIAKLRLGEVQAIAVKIDAIKNERSLKRRMIITQAKVSDPSGQLNLVWFNQPYLAQMFKPGTNWIFYGKTTWDFSHQRKMMASPLYEKENGILPIYGETEKLSSKILRRIIKPLLKMTQGIEDYFSNTFLAKKKLIPLGEALRNIHFPPDFSSLEKARGRLSFDELFFWNLRLQLAKKNLTLQTAPAIKIQEKLLKKFTASLPYQLTNAQRKAAWEIILDLKKSNPMNRLLEGDVGSGKTVVAAMAALVSAKNNYQTAWLAPTEILAIQHYENTKKMFKNFDVNVALVTSKNKRFNDEKLTTSGLEKKIDKADLIIGTHALLTGKIQLKQLALIIVDEQHRFGVQQRALLVKRDTNNPNASELSEEKDKIVERELSYKLNGIFFSVQDKLGRFCRERQYADEVLKRLEENQIKFRREQPIEIAGRKSNFADFIVEDKILVELKTKPFIEKEDYYQTKRYLETANLELGLIVNFRQTHLKSKRVLNPQYNSEKKFVAFGLGSDSSDRNNYVPHFLSMTATPIPRTLALALFSDLDLSIIDEMPKGRKKVGTKIISPDRRKDAYKFISAEIKKGRQVFVVCPLIEKKDNSFSASPKNIKILFDERKTVLEEYEKLSKKIFPEFRVAYLHGKLKAAEKEKTMADFKDGKYDILVSTSVIEVGVDVPNATVMMIEGAERFGLAQLHQFRGRVGRGEHQAFCFLFVEIWSQKIAARLRAFVNTHDGFKLAEEDLKLRGPGDLIGTMQSGMPDFKMASLSDAKMIEKSKKAAEEIVTAGIDNFPKIKQKLNEFYLTRHLE